MGIPGKMEVFVEIVILVKNNNKGQKQNFIFEKKNKKIVIQKE